MTHKKGLLSVMKIVGPDDEIMIVSEDGVIVRTPVKASPSSAVPPRA